MGCIVCFGASGASGSSDLAERSCRAGWDVLEEEEAGVSRLGWSSCPGAP
jgi:hypothetical protein